MPPLADWIIIFALGVVIGLAVVSPRLRSRWALVFAVVGLVGAVSNTVNGGLLG